jgi:uncharacterized membrane protein YccC
MPAVEFRPGCPYVRPTGKGGRTQILRILEYCRRHSTALALAVRVTVSAMLALLIARALSLPLPLWSVLTAVVLTQLSVGRSLKATVNYLAGTLGGAVYAGLIGALMPADPTIGLFLGLALAVAPVTLVAALDPRFGAAPFTAVLVVMAPTITHLGPVAFALDRVAEVSVGAAVGLFVSVTVFPARAHRLMIAAASTALEQLALLLPELFADFDRDQDNERVLRAQYAIGDALAQVNAIADEAAHERLSFLSSHPDHGPLQRTLLRLRHDLVIVGRATGMSVADRFKERLGPFLPPIAAAACEYMRACGVALIAERKPPPLDAVTKATEAYAGAMAGVRRDGLTRDLPADVAEQIFALSFALEELHRHLGELGRCVEEFSRRR